MNISCMFCINYQSRLNLEVCWRVVVKEIVEHKKEIFQNWKERKCGVKDHQPDNAGVLIAASYSEQTMLSWYVI